MLAPSDYLSVLSDSGVTFFTGVPDSLLKDFCACVTATTKPQHHVIAANEGASVGLAIGHYIGTGSLPLVYLQNSGLGNAVNPLFSLASPEVYGTPMLLMLGWRGEPGKKDEPQHVHQGRVLVKMLEDIDLPVVVLSDDMAQAEVQTKEAAQQARDINGPVALVVKKIPLVNMLLRRRKQTFLWDVKKRLLQLQKPLKTMPRSSVQLGCRAANCLSFARAMRRAITVISSPLVAWGMQARSLLVLPWRNPLARSIALTATERH
jgi:sulfopyruvate decarboxylase TPP-binding subunit